MSKVLLLTALLFTGFVGLRANGEKADLFKEWSYNSGKMPAGLSSYRRKGLATFVTLISKSVKTPNGDKALEVKILSPAVKVPHYKQLNFIYDSKITAGTMLKVEFMIKGSTRGKASASCIISRPPWKGLGKGSGKSFIVETEWKKITLEFAAAKDWEGKMRMPLLAIGEYPQGETLYIGPVRIFKTANFLSFKINKQWTLFAGVDANKIKLDTFKNIPTSLHGAKKTDISGIKVELKNNSFNIKDIFGYFKNKDAAIFFNEFQASKDGMMQLGASADWWFDFYINGKQAYSTMKSGGNSSHRFIPGDHVFNIPVKKGRNLIVVKVLSGSEGWKFACGKVPFKRRLSTITPIEEGKNWKAVNMTGTWNPKGIHPIKFKKLLIKSGTALDLSSFCDGPSGKYGRVIINKQGKLAFETKPKQAVRFRSFNLFLGWRSQFYKMAKKELREFAKAIQLRGYNMIRPHCLDFYIMGHSGLPGSKRKLQGFNTVKIPQREKDLPVDKEFLDRFDFFVSCLKEYGIYLDLTLTHGGGWTEAYPWIRGAKKNGRGYGSLIYFRDDLKKNWEIGARFLLCHKNPYTGHSLLEDNMIVNITFKNEQDIRSSHYNVFTPHWQAFLKDKYSNIEKLRIAWKQPELTSFSQIPAISNKFLQNGAQSGIDGIKFLEKIMNDITDFYYKTIRKIGYKGPVANWDMFMRLLDIPPRAKLSLTAMHTYHDHFNKYKLSSKKYVQKHYVDSWSKGNEYRFSQQSSIHGGADYMRRVAATRFIDRPFFINEYGHSAYNRYHHEQGLVFGAYGALQGWDSLGAHENLVMLYHMASPMFNSSVDPISRASQLVSAFAWMRGDVKTAKHSVDYSVTPEMLYSKECLSAIGAEYSKISLLTKIGNSYPVKPFEPCAKITADLTIKPKEFAWTGGSEYYAITKDMLKKGNILGGIVQNLRQKNILGKSNITDVRKGIFQSETGEIVLNVPQKTMTVITARLEGVIIKKDGTYKLNNLEVKSCSVPASVTAVSLDENSDLEHTKRMLLVFSTHAVGKHTVFASERFTTVIERGVFPMLMQTGLLKVNLKTTRRETPKIYALNMDGTREKQLTCKLQNNILSITIDTTKLKYATPYFEIVFP